MTELKDDTQSDMQFIEVLNIAFGSPRVERKFKVTIEDSYISERFTFEQKGMPATLEMEPGKTFVRLSSSDTVLKVKIKQYLTKSIILEVPLSVKHEYVGQECDVPLHNRFGITITLKFGKIRTALDVAQQRGKAAEESLTRVLESMQTLRVATGFLSFFIQIGAPIAQSSPIAAMAFSIGADALNKLSRIPKEYEELKSAALDCIRCLRFDDEAKKVFKSEIIQDIFRDVMFLTLKTLTLVSRYYSKGFICRIFSRESVEVTETIRRLDRKREALPNLFSTEIRAFLEQERMLRQAEQALAKEERKRADDERRRADDERKRAEEERKRAEEDRRQADENQARSKLRELLSASDSLQYGKTRCLLGTREAVLAKLQVWSEDITRSPLFWLHGPAGYGKSTIATTVCHELKSQRRLAGAFFCRRGDTITHRGSANSLFGHLAYFIARQHGPFRNALLQAISSDEFKDAKNHETYFDFVFTRPLDEMAGAADPSPHAAIIVVDALDECEEPVFAARNLLQIIDKAPWVRFLVTSRQPNIKNVFKAMPGPKHEHDLFDDDARSDIQKLLQHELVPTGRLAAMAVHIQPRLDAFVEHSQGLFQWVETMIKFIHKDEGNIEAVDAIVDKGSHPEAETTLDVLYRAVVESAWTGTKTNIEITRYVLAFVLASAQTRRLTAQIIHALLPPSLRVLLLTVENVLDRLSPILLQTDQGVFAIHTSVLDFLSDRNRCDERSDKGSGEEPIWVDPLAIHREMAHGCLEIMLHGTRRQERQQLAVISENLRFNMCKGDRMYERKSGSADVVDSGNVELCISTELRYSALSWFEHARAGWTEEFDVGQETKDATNYDKISTLLSSFLRSEKSLFWLEVVSETLSSDVYANTRFEASINRALFRPFRDLLLAIDAFGSSFQYECTTSPQLYTSLTWIENSSPLRDCWKVYTDYFYVLKRHESIENAEQAEPAIMEEKGISAAHAECGHDSYVHSVVFSPDGKSILSGSDDHTARIWHVETGQQKFLLPHSEGVWDASFSYDGTFVATYCTEDVRVWNASSGAQIHLLTDEEVISCFSFSPKRALIVTGTRRGSLLWWDIASGAMVYKLRVSDSSVRSVVFSPEGSLIAVGMNNQVQLRNAYSRALLADTIAEGVTSLIFSPNGSQLAVCTRIDMRVQVWDVREQTLSNNLTLRGISRIVFSPDERYLYGVIRDSIHCYDTQSGSEVGQSLAGHSDAILGISLSVEGDRIASCSKDNSIRIWDTCSLHSEIDRSMIVCGIRGHDRVPVAIPEAFEYSGGGWLHTTDGQPLLWVPYRFCGRVCDLSVVQITKDENDKPIRIDWDRLFRISGCNWPGEPGPQ